MYLPEAAVGDLGRSVSGRPMSPVPLNHYLQNMISPRSRAEYDEFNRFHFSQLRQLGRMDKREVTPKVRQRALWKRVAKTCRGVRGTVPARPHPLNNHFPPLSTEQCKRCALC